jgi:hypothetical protein
MLSMVTQRIVWKEYRQQRALFFCLLAFAVVIFLVGMNAVALELSDETSLSFILVGFHSLPLLFALGCGATLLAGERELDTLPWLRSLPLQAREVFWAKMGIAGGSTLLFALVILGASEYLESFHFLRDRQEFLPETGSYFILVLQLFGLTVVCSCLLQKVILAAMAGGFSCVALHVVLSSLFLQKESQRHLFEVSLVLQLVELGIVALLCESISRQWWHDDIRERSQFTLREKQGTAWQPWLKLLGWLPARLGHLVQIFLHLTWQEFRRAWWFVLGVYVVFAWLGMNYEADHSGHFHIVRLWPALVGALSFTTDQQGTSFRFFAERGISARRVWFARGSFWFMVSVLPLLLLFVQGFEEMFFSRPTASLRVLIEPEYLLYHLTAFMVGHLCSLLIRPSMVAICTALVATGGLLLLEHGNREVLPGLSLEFLLAGVTVLSLFTAWLRAPDWLLERNSCRAAGKIVGWNGVLLLLFGMLWIYQRVYSVPWVEPPFPVEALTSVEEINACVPAQYRTACLEFVASAEEQASTRDFETLGKDFQSQLPELNQRQLQRNAPLPQLNAEQAVQRAALVQRYVTFFEREAINFLAAPPHVSPGESHRFHRTMMTNWTIEQALQYEREQNFPAALDCYLAVFKHREAMNDFHWNYIIWHDGEHRFYDYVLRWAIREGQTAENIRAAIAKLVHAPVLRRYHSTELAHRSIATRRIREYIFRYRLIHGDLNLRNPLGIRYSEFVTRLPYLPWERQREARLLNYSFRVQGNWQLPRFGDSLGYMVYSDSTRELLTHQLEWNIFITRLQLLLYRAETGDFPATLAAMVDRERQAREQTLGRSLNDAERLELGNYFPIQNPLLTKPLEEAPLNEALNKLSLSSTEFKYYPQGLPYEFEGWSFRDRIPANTPILWLPIDRHEYSYLTEYQKVSARWLSALERQEITATVIVNGVNDTKSRVVYVEPESLRRWRFRNDNLRFHLNPFVDYLPTEEVPGHKSDITISEETYFERGCAIPLLPETNAVKE